eukprot:6148893-Prymnesium_polylepis.1
MRRYAPVRSHRRADLYCGLASARSAPEDTAARKQPAQAAARPSQRTPFLPRLAFLTAGCARKAVLRRAEVLLGALVAPRPHRLEEGARVGRRRALDSAAPRSRPGSLSGQLKLHTQGSRLVRPALSFQKRCQIVDGGQRARMCSTKIELKTLECTTA